MFSDTPYVGLDKSSTYEDPPGRLALSATELTFPFFLDNVAIVMFGEPSARR